MPEYLISTDLDGTLIDHHDYSFSAALPALNRCKSLGIPVVFNTSKTYDEARQLQEKLNIDAPLIVENGSALFFNNDTERPFSEKVFGTPRAEILSFIQQARQSHNWKLEGFHDWSTENIAQHTGLSLIDAEKASAKQFSEPFIWHDSEQALQQFSSLAEQQGLTVLKGGRFYHLQGRTDKSKPILWLQHYYNRLANNTHNGKEAAKAELIALGDNHNDIAMLNVADIAVCVRSPVADYPPLNTERPIIKTTQMGPAGWNEAILSILDG